MGVEKRTVKTSQDSWGPIYCGPCHPSIKIESKKKVEIVVEEHNDDPFADFFRPPTPVPELRWIRPKCPEPYLPPKCPDYSFVSSYRGGPEGVSYRAQNGPLLRQKKPSGVAKYEPEKTAVNKTHSEVKEPEESGNKTEKSEQNQETTESKEPEEASNKQEQGDTAFKNESFVKEINVTFENDETRTFAESTTLKTEKVKYRSKKTKIFATNNTTVKGKDSKLKKEIKPSIISKTQPRYIDDGQWDGKTIKSDKNVNKENWKPEIDINDIDLVAKDLKEFMDEVANDVEDFVGGVLNDVQKFKEGLRSDVDNFFNTVEKNRINSRRNSSIHKPSTSNQVLENRTEQKSNVKEGSFAGFSSLLRNLGF